MRSKRAYSLRLPSSLPVTLRAWPLWGGIITQGPAAVGEFALGFDDEVLTFRLSLAEEGVEVLNAVEPCGNFLVDKSCERGHEVHLAHELVGNYGGYVAFPVDEEGHVCAAVEEAVFTAAKTACGAVLANHFNGSVIVTVLKHRAVVRREDDEGVVQNSFFFEVFDELSHTPVGFDNGVASRTHGCGSGKAFVGSAGNVRLMETVIKEEGRVAVGRDEVFHLAHKVVGHVFVAPACSCAALHISYSGNAVDNGVVMAVVPFHAEHFGVVDGCGLAGEVVLVVDLNGVGGIEADHIAVLDIYRGHTVVGGCYEARVVEAYLVGSGGDGLVPVYFSTTHAEVPFAYGSGGIAGVAHHLGHGEFIFTDDERSVAGEDSGFGVAPGIDAVNMP